MRKTAMTSPIPALKQNMNKSKEQIKCGHNDKAKNSLYQLLYVQNKQKKQRLPNIGLTVSQFGDRAIEITESPDMVNYLQDLIRRDEIAQDSDFLLMKNIRRQYDKLPLLKDTYQCPIDICQQNEDAKTLNWYSDYYSYKYAKSMKERLSSSMGRTYGLNCDMVVQAKSFQRQKPKINNDRASLSSRQSQRKEEKDNNDNKGGFLLTEVVK